ncbi:MAG: hypothetical protein ABI560_05975 [Myxococcales bacterium]
MDALIGALDQLIAMKRDPKQAVMQQLLTDKTRLPGFTKGWDSPSLGELFMFKKVLWPQGLGGELSAWLRNWRSKLVVAARTRRARVAGDVGQKGDQVEPGQLGSRLLPNSQVGAHLTANLHVFQIDTRRRGASALIREGVDHVTREPFE